MELNYFGNVMMKKYWKTCVFVVFFTCWLLVTGIFQATAQQPGAKDYLIGVGDIIQIQVWDHDDLNRQVEVAPDGTFSFPFIGQVQASGKSVSNLEKHLIEKLSDGYLVAPQLTVSVAEYKNKKVFLFGEVNRPGSYVLKPDMRLLELISEAGGFTDNRGTACTIIRQSEVENRAAPIAIEDASGHVTVSINLSRLTAGDSDENVLLLPNDSIHISAAELIYVTGEVRRPGEIEYTGGLTVRQAISMAGGGTPQAALGRTIIIRMENGNEIELKPNLGDAVLPNDIIKVPESFF